MPVRLRITLLFTLLAFVILGVVCSGVYYFSYTSRLHTITNRLTNRAITTARLLSQREAFDRDLILRIDSLTTITLKNKTVQAYDHLDQKFYSYSDIPGDTLSVEKDILDDARVKGEVYFKSGDKEAIAYHYTDATARIVVVSAAEDVEGKQNLQLLRNILVLAFWVGNLLILISGYFFSRGLLRPVKKITEDVAEISAHNLTRRIKSGNSKDEWQQLTSTLNDLLNRLQESFEMQRRFISNASHELSTPLTSISSQLEVALQRERGAEEYRKVMQSIRQDVQNMNKLTQTLLEFAKASGNSGGLEIQPVRMDEIVMRLPAEMSKINFCYIVRLKFENLPEEEESLVVYGNEALLFTAVKNITLNACKYSTDNTAIVTLQSYDKQIAIHIQDKGIGMTEEEQGKVFLPFFRSEENLQGGFGLGLSLTERIVKLHKGQIRILSQKGSGTIMIIELPTAIGDLAF